MKTKNAQKEALKLLDNLNNTLNRLHSAYEKPFWSFYMNMKDKSLKTLKDTAKANLDAFKANTEIREKIISLMQSLTQDDTEYHRLAKWLKYFDCYQIPAHCLDLKKQINELETTIEVKRSKKTEGYTDPKTNEFVQASEITIGTMVYMEKDEALRKACFDALQGFALVGLDDYVQLVKLRNQFARELGYEDFYAYKLWIEEGMTKEELFTIFNNIFEKTLPTFDKIKELETKKPGLFKPWNYGYLLAGDFTAEEDQYHPLDQVLLRWGKSFMASGINYRGALLQLDLLDREGKFPNGFCHSPVLTHYRHGRRIAGQINFTCNVVVGQIGSAAECHDTLHHEGAHGGAFANADQFEICLNHEYPPLSTGWAETQSMFYDTLSKSSEWLFRYAKNKDGKGYPFELFERITRELAVLNPHSLHSIIRHCVFERAVYEEQDLTTERILELASEGSKKFYNFSEGSVNILNAIHLYSWESACSYHGYGLALLAVYQLREFFFDKYGYILDNPDIGEDMQVLWSYGSSKKFGEFIEFATGKKLSAEPWLKEMNRDVEQIIKEAEFVYYKLQAIPESTKPVDLGATIRMVSGSEVICDNSISFEDMCDKYATWLETQKVSK